MKKQLLSLMCLMAAAVSANAVENYTLQFGEAFNKKSVNSYTDTWTAECENITYSIVNFNNNQNKWSYVKCGRKNNASIASIKNSTVFAEAIDKISVTIDAVTADKVNSIYLTVGDTQDFSGTTKTYQPDNAVAKGDLIFTIDDPTVNQYYKLTFDCASASSNGVITVSKVVYNVFAGDINKEPAGLAYETTEYTVDLGAAFTAPVLTNPNNLAVTYDSDNEAVATVDAEGNVTINGYGKATITASSEATDEFNAGSASYIINVVPTATSIADFMELGKDDATLEIKVNFDMTVGFVNAKNIFATDGTSWIQIYGANTYAAGSVIPAGWLGTYTLYNTTTPEIMPTGSLPESTETAVPALREVSSVTTADVNEVLILKNAVLDAASPATKDNFTATVNGETVSMRNNYTIPSVEAGTYDIKGVVTIYQNAVSFYVIEFTEVAATPAAPVVTIDGAEVNDDSYTANSDNGEIEVALNVPEGCEVYYRITDSAVNVLADEENDGFQLYTEPVKVTDGQTLDYYAQNAAGVKSDIKSIAFHITTGIEAIGADDANAPVEFFNLQGQRVANPANGLYIRRQGNKVEKVTL